MGRIDSEERCESVLGKDERTTSAFGGEECNGRQRVLDARWVRPHEEARIREEEKSEDDVPQQQNGEEEPERR